MRSLNSDVRKADSPEAAPLESRSPPLRRMGPSEAEAQGESRSGSKGKTGIDV